MAVFSGLFIALVSGVGVMYSRQTKEIHYLYTTADESNTIFSREKVWLMSRACMISDNSSRHQWILHASKCDSINSEMPKEYNFFDVVQPSTRKYGYYFVFAGSSDINVTFNQGQQGIIKYLMKKDPSKAIYLKPDCARDGREIPTEHKFHEDGYYYICIINSGDTPLSYDIKVREHYYHREITRECNNISDHDGEKHMCCDFGPHETFAHHHCVYLTTRNTSPQRCEDPESVKVYMTYRETVRTLGIVAVVLTALACGLSLFVVFRVYRRRGGDQADHPV